MKTYKMNNLKPAASVLVFIALALLLCTGCGAKKPTMKFSVKADETSNYGQPVYLVVRTVNSSDFVSQDYQSVADLIMQNPPDETVLLTQLILPDRKTKFKIDKPDNRSLAVYCMFTDPDQWKVFLEKPLDKKYTFILENNNVSLKKGWF